MNSAIKLRYFFIFTLCIYSCKKFVEVPPPRSQLIGSTVYDSENTAAAAVTGIYQTMVNLGHTIGGGAEGISAYMGLSADEFALYPNFNAAISGAYANELTSRMNIRIWEQLYYSIYQANAAIDGLSNSTGISKPVHDQLTGESKFIRSLCYFYLVNIFGDVPLATKPDYSENSLLSRSPDTAVYAFIINDLKESKTLLSENYVNANGIPAAQRVRPNRATATALLARTYLYLKKWSEAELEATEIINNSLFQLETDLNKVFLADDNKEAIWQLESPNTGFNAPDGEFIRGYYTAEGPSFINPFSLNESLYTSFESGDARKANWTTSKTFNNTTYYFPFKYKLSDNTNQPPVEYPTVIRLAEIYLIRAEARAEMGNTTGAREDLNMIRTRAGLPDIISDSQPALLEALFKERRLELFTEYGHRWFDLIRTGHVSSVMGQFTPLKGGSWEITDKYYPIPLSDIQLNKNLKQNQGYEN